MSDLFLLDCSYVGEQSGLMLVRRPVRRCGFTLCILGCWRVCAYECGHLLRVCPALRQWLQARGMPTEQCPRSNVSSCNAPSHGAMPTEQCQLVRCVGRYAPGRAVLINQQYDSCHEWSVSAHGATGNDRNIVKSLCHRSAPTVGARRRYVVQPESDSCGLR